MKKLLTIILITLLTLFTATGCSCSGNAELTFNNAFFSTELNDEPSVGQIETAEYSVEYFDNYEGHFVKNLKVGLDKFDFSFSNGSYVTTLETVLEEASTYSSDIKKDVKYKLTSNFEIDVNYSINGGDTVTKTDTISSEVYFCDRENSYAPVYSKVTSSQTAFNENENGITVSTVKIEHIVKYNTDSYTINKKVIVDDKAPVITKTTEDYSFMTIIDNAQFLFAIRNIDVKTQSSYKMPVLQLSYNLPQTLDIYNESTTNKQVELSVNGTDVSGEISMNNFRFNLDSTDTSGMYQYFSIQNGGLTGFNDLSHVCVYAQPIITSNNMSLLGSLVYTLKSITNNY
jgi:hypothetical protein